MKPRPARRRPRDCRRSAGRLGIDRVERHVNDSVTALLGELKVVADIAELHRSLPEAERLVVAAAGACRLSSAVAETGETPRRPPSGDRCACSSASVKAHSATCIEPGIRGSIARWPSNCSAGPTHGTIRSAHSSIDEGRLLARVRHPNVVTVYGADRIDGRVGLWMEFVRGRTIEAVLRNTARSARRKRRSSASISVARCRPCIAPG